MKRKLYALLIILALGLPVFAMSATSHAVNITPICSGKVGGTSASNTSVCKDVNTQSKSNKNPILNILKTALNIISYVAGIAAIILIVIAGITFMTSGGDPQSVSSARNTIIYAIVGIIILVVSQAIITFIIDKVLA